MLMGMEWMGYLFSVCGTIHYNGQYVLMISRSQWPRGLRHELSSLARTLGSWARILFKAWMSVLCVFIVFVLFCV
jgi:hypothetical protein